MPQRADEVVLTHQHGAAAGLQNVDGLVGSRPVGGGTATTCPMSSSQRPGSVRLQVSSARRRMLPAEAISVITTLTQTSVPPPARSAAPHPLTAARVPQDRRMLRAGHVPLPRVGCGQRCQPIRAEGTSGTTGARPQSARRDQTDALGRPGQSPGPGLSGSPPAPFAPDRVRVVRLTFWRRNAQSGSDGWMYRIPGYVVPAVIAANHCRGAGQKGVPCPWGCGDRDAHPRSWRAARSACGWPPPGLSRGAAGIAVAGWPCPGGSRDRVYPGAQ